MEEDKNIFDLKNMIKGLDEVNLLEILVFIEEVISEYENLNTT